MMFCSLIGDLFIKFCWVDKIEKTQLLLKVKKISVETSCFGLLNVHLNHLTSSLPTRISPPSPLLPLTSPPHHRVVGYQGGVSSSRHPARWEKHLC